MRSNDTNSDSKPATRSLRMLSLLSLLAVGISCSENPPPESEFPWQTVAVWHLGINQELSPASTAFEAVVNGLSCNGGAPHIVLEPTIVKSESEIAISFTVEPPSPGFHTCQGGLGSGYPVDLGEPIGNRRLIDPACVEGEAATTAFCNDGPVQWSPEAVPTTVQFPTTTATGSRAT
jgi:hypothetical protein